MDEKKLTEMFQWLHRHPELSGREYETTAYLKSRLQEYGIRLLDTGLETGLIAEIGSGEGPVIALRADMDALPVQEKSGLPYASEVPGVMHACGHDFHSVCMLGAAWLLKQREAQLAGTVRIIFQPAEEIGDGSEIMVKTGLLQDVQVFYAGHTYPWYPAGVVGIHPGPAMAAADRFAVTIRGKGCHGANPEKGIDPIPAMAAVIAAYQTVVSRQISPLDSAVVSVTRAQAGNSWNVTPETAFLEGTVRTTTNAVRERIRESLERMAGETARAYGCEAAFEYEWGSDPVINDEAACARAAEAARETGLKVEVNPVSMIAEDFSSYLKLAPGAMIRVGTGGGFDNHHPSFTADPAALLPAARFFALLAEKELRRLKAESAGQNGEEKTNGV